MCVKMTITETEINRKLESRRREGVAVTENPDEQALEIHSL